LRISARCRRRMWRMAKTSAMTQSREIISRNL
jgi:hypothetical protein